MTTLQNEYNLIEEGKGSKAQLMKQAKMLFPHLINNLIQNQYPQVVSILKNKGIIVENKSTTKKKKVDSTDWVKTFKKNISKNINEIKSLISLEELIDMADKAKDIVEDASDALMELGEVSNKISVDQVAEILSNYDLDWGDVTDTPEKYSSLYENLKERLNEGIKATEKETSKEVLDTQKHAYDPKAKTIDNVYGQSFLNGYYTELKDPDNKDKTVDQLLDIVAKNMFKDINYYLKNGQFGTKGLGVADINKQPGLPVPGVAKGVHKSSGYGDLPDGLVDKIKANVKATLGNQEAKTGDPKKVKKMSIDAQSSKGVTKTAAGNQKWKTVRAKKLNESKKNFKFKLSESLIKENEVLNLAPDLEKLNDDQADTYFNRRSQIENGSKQALEDAGYTVEHIDTMDVSDDELPWNIYKVTKGYNYEDDDDMDPAGGTRGLDGYLEESKLRKIISKVIKEEMSSRDHQLLKLKTGDRIKIGTNNEEVTIISNKIKPGNWGVLGYITYKKDDSPGIFMMDAENINTSSGINLKEYGEDNDSDDRIQINWNKWDKEIRALALKDAMPKLNASNWVNTPWKDLTPEIKQRLIDYNSDEEDDTNPAGSWDIYENKDKNWEKGDILSSENETLEFIKYNNNDETFEGKRLKSKFKDDKIGAIVPDAYITAYKKSLKEYEGEGEDSSTEDLGYYEKMDKGIDNDEWLNLARVYSEGEDNVWSKFLDKSSVKGEGDRESYSLDFNLLIPKSEVNYPDSLLKTEEELDNDLTYSSHGVEGNPGGSYSRRSISVSEKGDNYKVEVRVRGGLDI